MKIRQIFVMTVIALALTACRGERATMTGAYGSGVVTGEVVMASQGSPAGVEVSVRGTGQTAVLSEDGRFAFGSVPENATLDFRRANDGIAASLQLTQASGNVVIELAKSEARRSSKQRGVKGSRSSAYEFEGVVRSTTADSLVVFTSHQEEVTIAVTETTGIRKGNKVMTLAELVPDTRVHVKALKVADAYTAALIIVQSLPGEEDGGEEDGGTAVQTQEYEGIVRTAAADQLVIFDSHQQEVTFILNADTTIRKGSTPILPADIQVGWRVHVKATTNATDGTNTATLVIVQNQNNEVKLSGLVATNDGTTLTVTTETGVVTIQTDASTKIVKRGQTVALADVLVGSRVKVDATVVDASTSTYLAKVIEVK